jgi:CRP/FNR family transcriptional regulator, cyclic AMP receptor protein
LDLLIPLLADLGKPFHSTRGIAMLAFTLLGVAFVILASFVRTMVPLRALTVASNVFLLVGAILVPEPGNIVLYLVLTPVNLYRLVEIRKLTRQVEAASRHGDLTGLWLRPYMKAHKLAAGEVLFRQGDDADSLHLLVEGELELVEIGKKQPAGEIFGEISFFAPDHRRTLTARCATPCVVLGIAGEIFRQLYFQEPKLAFQISSLIAHRLGADIQRVQHENERLRTRLAALEARGSEPVAQPLDVGAQPARDQA